MSTCIISLRRGVGLLAKCVSGLIMSNYNINTLLLKLMKKETEKKQYDGFYI